MLFTSGTIIVFFCFAFYLIWDQFLRKDARLSTGLRILKKKISQLENLSSQVDTQIERQMNLIQETMQRLELMTERARILNECLEKHYRLSVKNSPLNTAGRTRSQKTSSHTKQKSLQFGQSPFTDFNFAEESSRNHSSRRNPDSSP